MISAYNHFLKNIFNSHGVTTRKQYWWVRLTLFAVYVVITIFLGVNLFMKMSSLVSGLDTDATNRLLLYFDSATTKVATIGATEYIAGIPEFGESLKSSVLVTFSILQTCGIIITILTTTLTVRRLRDAGVPSKVIRVLCVLYIGSMLLFGGMIYGIISLVFVVILPLFPTKYFVDGRNAQQ